MKTALLILMGIAMAFAACRPKESQIAKAPAGPLLDSPYVKIWVSRAGVVQLDGKPTELASVETVLSALAQKKGIVLYGRDGAQEEPHPNGMKVIQMVVANRLPIRMSTKPDFSDAVGPDGRLKE